MTTNQHTLARWRLVLGQSAEACQVTCAGDAHCERIEQLVGYLFRPGGATGGAGPRGGSRQGGQGDSVLTIPDWVDAVSELFPRQAKEVLEQLKNLRRRTDSAG